MLTGVTVVDFSRHLPGPICTMRLADLGAEVMEITSFPVSDHGKSTNTASREARETGAFYLRSHRNHKSISLNLRTDEGKALAFALARQADVVVESFRPGVLRHLGLDYDSLWEVYPSVIYCSITGYGQSGEMYQLGGNDLNIQAVSGYLSTVRDAEGKPVIADLPLADYAVGLYACEQVCAALVQRSRTGRGAYLDVASGDLLSSWMGLHAILSKSSAPKDYSSVRKGLLSYQVYETADGQYVALAALEEKFWHNFCRAVGRQDWEILYQAAVDEHAEVYEDVKTLFLSRTQSEWSELGMEVDCCLTAVEEKENWAESPYVTSREIAYTLPYLERKEASSSDHISPAWYTDHTHDLLRKKLHLTEAELSRLQKHGVIPAIRS
ncbi:MAG: hypothetical protein K0R47_2625 [Brevibacillus sp.]|nr:hypothetical protein [Brevibacillus sp.]